MCKTWRGLDWQVVFADGVRKNYATLPASTILPKRLRSITLIFAALPLFSAAGALRPSEPLPAAPDGLILDLSHVLLPERAAALASDLQTAAREQSIWIYVVTFPSLGGPPSRQSELLAELAHRLSDHWLSDRLGVVILFNDETGAEIVVASQETERRFPSLKLTMGMSEPLHRAKREHLSRDKVEATARVVLDEISGLGERALKAARRDRVTNWAMLVIAIGGVTVAILTEWAKAEQHRLRHPE